MTKNTNTILMLVLLFLPSFCLGQTPFPPNCVTIGRCSRVQTPEDKFNDMEFTVKPSTSWTVNSTLDIYPIIPSSSAVFKPILYNSRGDVSLYVHVALGFFRNMTDEFFLVIVAIKYGTELEVLWTANQRHPVTSSATLEFNGHGDLVLNDVSGVLVWSTNTSGKGIVKMKLLDQGNLVLHDAKNMSIWSSWDYPTNILLSEQKLHLGQKLYANVSPTNITPGNVYLSLVNGGLQAFVELFHTQQMYMMPIDSRYGVEFSLVIEEMHAVYQCYVENEFCYLKFDFDGHLRQYQWTKNVVEDMRENDDCEYPTVCGEYGICISPKQCICPVPSDGDESYFKPLNHMQPNLGCVKTTPLACNSSEIHFIELQNVSYFNFVEDMWDTDALTCNQACMKNCSCQAVVFHYNENPKLGNCSFQSEVLSFNGNKDFNKKWTTFLKVQSPPSDINPRPIDRPTGGRRLQKSNKKVIIWSSITETIVFVSLIIGISVVVLKRQASKVDEAYDSQVEGDDRLDKASDMPKRFSHEDLKSATSNFSKKIGGGGFGSVYEGTIGDATKIAVKRLDSLGQGSKEFFAEVKTIGNIHHVNLVKLIGFCSENSHRLLVYEYMSNGSLDKWIYNKDHSSLGWETRRTVIRDIAKGLTYLHEECRKTIVHLDIKPQNVLLDAKFNVKLSDFGLARLIERDQSQVLTTFRGTRGYLAPEWFLNKRISEKVDVYSFGIVVLEIVCGRRNLDHSQPEEDDCLLNVVRRKAEENQLHDVVDMQNEDVQSHKEEAVEMIKIAIACLHSDSTRRPAMSKVVKILEGGMEMETISNYSFLTLNQSELYRKYSLSGSAPLLPSILSGPR